MPILLKNIRADICDTGVSLPSTGSTDTIEITDLHVGHAVRLISIRDAGEFRDRFGIPHSVTDADLESAVQIIKKKDKAASVGLITTLQSWASLGDTAVQLVHRIWDFFRDPR